MEFCSAIKNNEIAICWKANGTVDYHFKQSKSVSQRQVLCVFSHMGSGEGEVHVSKGRTIKVVGGKKDAGRE